MRARILPLDDLAEYGKTERVALILTLSHGEAQSIIGDLGDDDGNMCRNSKKLFELLQIVAEPDVYRRRMAQDIMNTEGRKRVEEGSPHASQRGVDTWPN